MIFLVYFIPSHWLLSKKVWTCDSDPDVRFMVELVGQRKWESKPASLERGEVNAQNFINTMMVQWPSVDTLKEPHSVLSLLFLERARTWMGSDGGGQGCCAVLSWGTPTRLPYLTILQVGAFRCWAQLWCEPSVFILIWMASSRQNAIRDVYILTKIRDAKLLKSLIFRKIMQEPGSTLYIATHKILFLYFLSNMVKHWTLILLFG